MSRPDLPGAKPGSGESVADNAVTGTLSSLMRIPSPTSPLSGAALGIDAVDRESDLTMRKDYTEAATGSRDGGNASWHKDAHGETCAHPQRLNQCAKRAET